MRHLVAFMLLAACGGSPRGGGDEAPPLWEPMGVEECAPGLAAWMQCVDGATSPAPTCRVLAEGCARPVWSVSGLMDCGDHTAECDVLAATWDDMHTLLACGEDGPAHDEWTRDPQAVADSARECLSQ